MHNNNKREEIAKLLRESIVPRPHQGGVTIQNLVVVLTPGDGQELLAALQQALRAIQPTS